MKRCRAGCAPLAEGVGMEVFQMVLAQVVVEVEVVGARLSSHLHGMGDARARACDSQAAACTAWHGVGAWLTCQVPVHSSELNII